ncbi:MAG TPA: hypothetical protein VFT91_04835 [Dehalococcoidia bacterium]|nr:hypothetical protein [Dehalococcoidia bacterium]
MAKAETASQAFWRAFQALPSGERRAVIERLLKDRAFREELLDVSLVLERDNEPSRPYEEFAEELRREGRL